MDDTLREAWDAESRAWIEFARSSDADPVFFHFNWPTFERALPESAGLTLDLGCGEGRVGRELRRLGHHVVGLDVVSAFAHATATHPDGLPAVVGDAASLPVVDGAVATVVMFMVLHDVDDLDGVIREAARVLRVGGWLCVALTHPLQTIGDSTGEDRTGPYLLQRSYFEEKRLTYWAERSGVRVALNTTHRPLSSYIQAICDAGLVVDYFGEPVPSTQMDLADFEQRCRVPSVVHIRARRI